MRIAESVTLYHVDKLCDRISDAILDECLKQDPLSRVAVETMGGHGIITVTGEMTTKAYVNVREIVERVIGYPYGVQVNIVKQSPDISQGVNIGGAGDQGIMVGYACNENEAYIPQELYLARKILKPFIVDGKSQVVLSNNGNIENIVLSVQGKTQEELEQHLDKIGFKDVDRFCNNTGKFDIGGFDADTGVTGRKIVVDAYGPRVPVGGGAFCVDAKTEYLTHNGWKRLDKYEKGDLVGQYNENGTLELVEPIEYIDEPCETMYEVEGNTNISQALTANHNFVYISSKGNLNKKPFIEVKKQHEESELGFSGKVIPFFDYEGGDGIELTNEEIRLQIAFMADGTLSHQRRVRLLRVNKIERLHKLLREAGYDYEVRNYADGYTYFYFEPPILSKLFDTSFWMATKEQLGVIADEVVKWDGDGVSVYRTTRKENADFIQFVFTVVNQSKCSILIDDRMGEEYGKGYERKSVCYDVCSNKTKYETLKRKSGEKLEIKEIEPENRMKYCFTVPSGMLVLRRNNRIFITGNSGKDPTKVDRSAAYMARYIALQMLKEQNADEVLVRLGYVIGKEEPLLKEAIIDGCEIVKVDDKYDCRPEAIIEMLDLRKPIYEHIAMRGHFGFIDEYTWERI